jgi:peptidoglycan/xylan/chitin deacetylase (PgdA/CDA1 family)
MSRPRSSSRFDAIRGLGGTMPAPVADRLREALAVALLTRARLSARPVGAALVYHRIGDRQQPRDDNLVAALGARLFEAQLKHVARHYRAVPASGLLDAVRARRQGERIPLAITFDDDLRSHLTHATPILERRGLPATFFVSGASREGPAAFWWERLQAVFDRRLATEEELAQMLDLPESALERSGPTPIRRVAATIQDMPREDRARASGRLLELLGSDPPDIGLRADELRAMVGRGFELGFHTLRHDALPGLDDGELADALRVGRPELEAATGVELTTISYPHGRGDARVAAAAREAGYASGYTGRPEPIGPDSNPLLLGRRYPSYESPARFALAVARLVSAPTGLR